MGTSDDAPAKCYINTIFPELLSKIFDLAKETGASNSSSNLRLVCKKWDSVAVSTAALWASISVKGEDLAHADFLIGLDRTLTRSKTSPLTIKVDLTGFSDLQDDIYGRFVDQLRQRCSQIRKLTAVNPEEGLLKQLTVEPSLRELRLTLEKRTPLANVHITSQLTNLSIAGGSNIVYDAAEPTSLVYLRADTVEHIDSWIDLIFRSPLLETLVISFTSATIPDNPEPVILPKLKTLVIKVLDPSPLDPPKDTFLNLITAPALTTLKIFVPIGAWEIQQQLIMTHGLIQRSQCTIEEFAITGPPDDRLQYDLLQVLQSSPLIHTLDIGIISPALFDLLILTSKNLLLPKLTRLRVLIEPSEDYDDERALTKFLRSRYRQDGSGLKEVFIWVYQVIGYSDILLESPKLQVILDKGMVLSFGYESGYRPELDPFGIKSDV